MEGRMEGSGSLLFSLARFYLPAFSSSFKRRHRDVGYVSTYKGGFPLWRYFYVRK